MLKITIWSDRNNLFTNSKTSEVILLVFLWECTVLVVWFMEDLMQFSGLFSVTKCNRAEIALSILRENKNGFDVVISDVHMPDMDGFKLLEHIGLEMDLPVISKHLDSLYSDDV